MGSGNSSERVFVSATLDCVSFVCLADSGADISLILMSTFDRINAARDTPITIDSTRSVPFKALGPGTVLYTCGLIIIDVYID